MTVEKQAAFETRSLATRRIRENIGNQKNTCFYKAQRFISSAFLFLFEVPKEAFLATVSNNSLSFLKSRSIPGN